MTVVSEYVSEYCIWLVLRSGLEQLSSAGQLPFSVVDLNNTGVIVTGRLHTYLSSGTVLQSVFAIFLFNQLYSKRKLTDRLSFLKNYAIFYRAMMVSAVLTVGWCLPVCLSVKLSDVTQPRR